MTPREQVEAIRLLRSWLTLRPATVDFAKGLTGGPLPPGFAEDIGRTQELLARTRAFLEQQPTS